MKNIVKQYDGSPYARLVATAKIAQQDGVIKGILLHQGESNSTDNELAGQGKGHLRPPDEGFESQSQTGALLAGELKSKEEHGVCYPFNTNILVHLPEFIPNAHIISSQGVRGTRTSFI